MPPNETLLSLAEICAAFAGFAALVSALRRGSDRVGGAIHDLLRLRLVISSSVAGVVAALLPVGIAEFGVDPSTLWRLAAVAFLIFDNGIILSFVRAYQPVKQVIQPDRLAVSVVSMLELLEQSCLVAVVAGLWVDNAAALYITALIANISQAGFIFVRFVGSTFSHEHQLDVDGA